MKDWALHAPGKLRADGVLDPLCGQRTGFGAKGCDQALFGGKWAKVTCKKCLRLLPKVSHRLCERCGKAAPKRRVKCHRCHRLICRGCAELDFGAWWCASAAFDPHSPVDCYRAAVNALFDAHARRRA